MKKLFLIIFLFPLLVSGQHHMMHTLAGQTGVQDDILIIMLHGTTSPVPYISTDVGDSFTTGSAVTDMDVSSLPLNLRMSADKQYVTFVGNSANQDNLIFQSSNGGTSFAGYSTTASYLWGNYMSDDGSIRVVGTSIASLAYVSNDYGSSYTSKTITNRSRAVAGSSDGQYIKVTNPQTGTAAAKSDNYGDTWSTYTQPFLAGEIASDATGNYLYVTPYGQPYTNAFAYSTNGGTSWTILYTDFSISGTGWHGTVRCSASGQYVLLTLHNTTPKTFVSNNYGVTGSWTDTGLTAPLHYTQSMSENGKYMIVGKNSATGTFYISDDYGVTWTEKTTGLNATMTASVIN